MPLGMKMAPLIPRVPAVVTCGCWMYLWHVWIALMYFFGLGSATDPDQLTASIYLSSIFFNSLFRTSLPDWCWLLPAAGGHLPSVRSDMCGMLSERTRALRLDD